MEKNSKKPLYFLLSILAFFLSGIWFYSLKSKTSYEIFGPTCPNIEAYKALNKIIDNDANVKIKDNGMFGVLDNFIQNLQKEELDFLKYNICYPSDHNLKNPCHQHKDYETKYKKMEWVINLFSPSFTNFVLGKDQPKLPSVSDKNKTLKICLVNQWPGASLNNNFRFINEIVQEQGYKTVQSANAKDCDIVIDGIFSKEEIINKQAFKISFTGESNQEKTEGYDLSLGFNYYDDISTYQRFPLYYINFSELVSNEYKRGTCAPKKERFACFLVSNGRFEKRNQIFHKLSSYKKVDSGGRYLNNTDHLIGWDETYNFLSQCKFVIAYENTLADGYMTEKLFQAYYAGAVPIYYSDPKAQNDINKKAIISAQEFKNDDEMLKYIIDVDSNDEKYCEIWNQSIIDNPERNYLVQKEIIRQKMIPFLER